MFLFFVRHGYPDYSRDCLTEYGKKQAQAVAERFSQKGLDKIYASTMGRATETAEFTAKKLGLKITGVDFAREDLTGKEFGVTTENGEPVWCFWDKRYLKRFNSEEVRKLDNKWYDDPFFADGNFKSGTLRVKKAVKEFMEELGYRYDENNRAYTAIQHKYDRVALFAHGGFSMIFTSCLLGIPYPVIATRFQHVGTSGITVFEIRDEGEDIIPRIWQYGNDGHLYKNEILDGFDLRPL